MDSKFSLRAIALAVLAESETEDREQILKEIEHRVPRKQLDEAFRQALPAFLHQVGPRWTAPVPRPGEDDGKRATGRSSKVAAVREAWRRHLEGRYSTATGELRRLGDFSYDDLMFKAGELEQKAERNYARAASMKALAGALAEHEAERVRDLPVSVLAGFFGALPEDGEAE